MRDGAYVAGVMLHSHIEDSSGSTLENNIQYLHRDHLGSVDAISGETGSESVAYNSYSPFGERRNAATWAQDSSASSDMNRGFTDHEHLDEVGLIHMNGRVYDPVLGRFLSADLVVQAPQFSQSYNRYSYTWNNPLSFTDPTGFLTEIKGETLAEYNVGSAFYYEAYYSQPYLMRVQKPHGLTFQSGVETGSVAQSTSWIFSAEDIPDLSVAEVSSSGIRWEDLSWSAAGFTGNTFGFFVGTGLIGAPDPSFATKPLGYAIAGKSLAGMQLNAYNFWRAFSPDDQYDAPLSLGRLVAHQIDPGNQNLKLAADAMELSLDVAAGNVAYRSVPITGSAMTKNVNIFRYLDMTKPVHGSNLARSIQGMQVIQTGSYSRDAYQAVSSD